MGVVAIEVGRVLPRSIKRKTLRPVQPIGAFFWGHAMQLRTLDQIAEESFSPVRIRMTESISLTKIFPSPI
jgi:hypothetical protein